jgi:hypothetical protein
MFQKNKSNVCVDIVDVAVSKNTNNGTYISGFTQIDGVVDVKSTYMYADVTTTNNGGSMALLEESHLDSKYIVLLDCDKSLHSYSDTVAVFEFGKVTDILNVNKWSPFSFSFSGQRR